MRGMLRSPIDLLAMSEKLLHFPQGPDASLWNAPQFFLEAQQTMHR